MQNAWKVLILKKGFLSKKVKKKREKRWWTKKKYLTLPLKS